LEFQSSSGPQQNFLICLAFFPPSPDKHPAPPYQSSVQFALARKQGDGGRILSSGHLKQRLWQRPGAFCLETPVLLSPSQTFLSLSLICVALTAGHCVPTPRTQSRQKTFVSTHVCHLQTNGPLRVLGSFSRYLTFPPSFYRKESRRYCRFSLQT
jgi:hypothetical protein